MIGEAQRQFAKEMMQAARVSEHVFPDFAAAEACLESSWGLSTLCARAKNVFGLKVPSSWEGATIAMPTQEFLDGKWITQTATWPVFDTYLQAFNERMKVLKDNMLYAEALAASDGQSFVLAVSKHWSTDPKRGEKCLRIYAAHRDIFFQPQPLTV